METTKFHDSKDQLLSRVNDQYLQQAAKDRQVELERMLDTERTSVASVLGLSPENVSYYDVMDVLVYS